MTLNSSVSRQRAFAEERELIELVAEVGEEQHVLGRAKALRRNAASGPRTR